MFPQVVLDLLRYGFGQGRTVHGFKEVVRWQKIENILFILEHLGFYLRGNLLVTEGGEQNRQLGVVGLGILGKNKQAPAVLHHLSPELRPQLTEHGGVVVRVVPTGVQIAFTDPRLVNE